jgi:dihydrofolate reductase
MKGGTTFHVVTDGIESAFRNAKEPAGDRNVRIVGGATTVNQYLAVGHIDELGMHIVPVTIGDGTRLFEGVPNLKLEAFEISGTRLV